MALEWQSRASSSVIERHRASSTSGAYVEGIRVGLSKARAGHDDEARGIEHLERVELVGRHLRARGGRGGSSSALVPSSAIKRPRALSSAIMRHQAHHASSSVLVPSSVIKRPQAPSCQRAAHLRLASGGDCLDGQLDAREEVESSFGGRTRHAREVVEGEGERVGARAKRLEDAAEGSDPIQSNQKQSQAIRGCCRGE